MTGSSYLIGFGYQCNSRGFRLAAGRHRLPSGLPDILPPQGRCCQAYTVGLVLPFVLQGSILLWDEMTWTR